MNTYSTKRYCIDITITQSTSIWFGTMRDDKKHRPYREHFVQVFAAHSNAAWCVACECNLLCVLFVFFFHLSIKKFCYFSLHLIWFCARTNKCASARISPFAFIRLEKGHFWLVFVFCLGVVDMSIVWHDRFTVKSREPCIEWWLLFLSIPRSLARSLCFFFWAIVRIFFIHFVIIEVNFEIYILARACVCVFHSVTWKSLDSFTVRWNDTFVCDFFCVLFWSIHCVTWSHGLNDHSFILLFFSSLSLCVTPKTKPSSNKRLLWKYCHAQNT